MDFKSEAVLKNEQKLKYSLDYYQKLFDEFPSLIWMSDTEGRCTYFNKSWCDFTRLKFNEQMQDVWLEVLHPEDKERFLSVFLAALKNKQSFEIEYRLLRNDGKYRWVKNMARPVYDLEGNYTGFVSNCFDNTVSKRALAKNLLLHEMAAKFFAGESLDNILQFVCSKLIYIYEFANVWIGIKEDDGRISCRAAAGRISNNFLRLKLRWDDTNIDNPLAYSISTGNHCITKIFNCTYLPWKNFAQKHNINASLTLPMIVNGITLAVLCISSEDEEEFSENMVLEMQNIAEQVALAWQTDEYKKSMARDLLERKRNEELLQRYELLSKHTNDIILMLDSQGNIIEANNAAVIAFGYSRQELLKLNIDEIRELIGLDLAELGNTPHLIENIYRRKDGSTFCVEVNIQGAVINGEKAFVAIVRDINERVKADAHNKLFYEVALKVLEEKPIDKILQFVCERLANNFEIPIPLVWVGLKEADGTISVQASSGSEKAILNKMCLRWDGNLEDQCPAGRAIYLEKPIIVHSDHPAYQPWGQMAQKSGIQSVASFPLSVHGKVLGVLCVGAPIAHYFDNTVFVNLQNFAGQIAIAMQAAFNRNQLLLQTAALRAAELKIKKERQRLFTLLEELPAYIYLLDKSYTVKYANKYFREYFGHGVNKKCYQIKHGRNTVCDACPCKELFENKKYHKAEWKRPDGKTFQVHKYVFTDTDDSELIMEFGIDITEIKEAEGVFQRYQLLFEGVRDIILMMRTDGTLIEANKAAEAAYGFSKTELLKKNIRDLRDPVTHKLLDEEMKKARDTGLLFETAHRRKDGSVFTIEASSQSAVIGGEEVLISIIRDITERKQAEQKMLEARERAERAERLASLGTMAAGIAHEINQPLNSLKVTADGMLYWYKKGKKLSINNVMDNIQTISEQAARIDDIIKHMRSFVKSDFCKQLSPCDVNKAVEAAINILGHQLTSHGISIEKKLQGDLPMIMAVDVRLEEIVINLIVNSLQALDNLDKKDKKIICQTNSTPNSLILTISDNGPGIDPQIKDKIFEPFFTTKTVGEGMGLGLSIVYSIVNSFNGEISVNNNAQGGAEFKIEFPLYIEN